MYLEGFFHLQLVLPAQLPCLKFELISVFFDVVDVTASLNQVLTAGLRSPPLLSSLVTVFGLLLRAAGGIDNGMN